jgi:hypothetical protein
MPATHRTDNPSFLTTNDTASPTGGGPALSAVELECPPAENRAGGEKRVYS